MRLVRWSAALIALVAGLALGSANAQAAQPSTASAHSARTVLAVHNVSHSDATGGTQSLDWWW